MSSRSNHARLVALEKQMEAAAAAFDFEKAAALRDGGYMMELLGGDMGPVSTVA